MVSKIIAIIYPLFSHHIARIGEGKDVFCKFVGRGKPKVQAGNKILFYRSGGSKEIVGEATISKIEYLEPNALFSKYAERLFITQEEFQQYVNKRARPEGREILVLVLKDVKKYPKPFRMEKPITMAGMTVTRWMYRKISGQM